MTDPTAAELDAICARLTKAQRKAIKEAVWNDERGEWRAFAMYPADKNLRAKGLAIGLWGKLTPLGVATRKRLIERMNG